MPKTIRTRRGSARLDVSRGDKLVFSIARSGPGAVFTLTDDDADDSPLLSMDDLGGSMQALYEWELRSSIQGGQAVLRLHRTDGQRIGTHEFRTSDPDEFVVYRVSMSFMFLGQYTLVVNHCKADGTLVREITDIDFTGDNNKHVEESSTTVLIVGIP